MKKSYFVKSNYLVEIDGKDVSIYKSELKIEPKKEDFNVLVKKYKVEKIFIGKVPSFKRKPKHNWFWKLFYEEEKEEEMELSEEHQKKFEGNTILLRIKRNKYVYIRNLFISEFTTGNDRIIDYISPLENSNEAYPIATGERYFYFLFDDSKILRDKIPEKIQKNPFSMIDYLHTDMDRELITTKIVHSSI